eukprot:403331456
MNINDKDILDDQGGVDLSEFIGKRVSEQEMQAIINSAASEAQNASGMSASDWNQSVVDRLIQIETKVDIDQQSSIKDYIYTKEEQQNLENDLDSKVLYMGTQLNKDTYDIISDINATKSTMKYTHYEMSDTDYNNQQAIESALDFISGLRQYREDFKKPLEARMTNTNKDIIEDLSQNFDTKMQIEDSNNNIQILQQNDEDFKPKFVSKKLRQTQLQEQQDSQMQIDSEQNLQEIQKPAFRKPIKKLQNQVPQNTQQQNSQKQNQLIQVINDDSQQDLGNEQDETLMQVEQDKKVKFGTRKKNSKAIQRQYLDDDSKN